MRLGRRRGWWIIALAVFSLTALLRASGQLAFLEAYVADARARLLLHEVPSEIAIVGIDARSLAELSRWPWPRRLHAQLIRQLATATPRQVFLDIDFSSVSNAEDDAALEAALAEWRGKPILLPAFVQHATAAGTGLLLTRPLERFASHAQLVSVNRQPGADGLERSWRSSWGENGALPTVIDPESALPSGLDVPIDFSISPASFAYVSYVDLLEGRIAAAELEGKVVYVGGTAVELGDMVPVPVHRSLPGVVVQALATETVKQGRLRMPPSWLYLAVLASWTAICAALFHAHAWRRNLLLLSGTLGLLVGVSVYGHWVHRLVLEVVPLALATSAVFLVVTLRSLDEQTWRAIAFGIGMRRRDALLRSIVQSSSDCIVCIDEQGLIRTANRAAGHLFGCSAPAMIGTPFASFLPQLGHAPGEPPRPVESLVGAVSECEARGPNGHAFPVEITLSRVRLRNERLYTAIVRDISERKAQQRSLEFQATHDSLTQLPNRAALAAHLDSAMAESASTSCSALLMLDLSRFKEVNDTLGHNVGDQVLREVARRFKEATGADDFIARIGGDEFTVVLAGRAETTAIAQACQRLVDSLQTPVDIGALAIEIGVSIGIARFPQDAQDAQTLLRHADVAMYVAKRRGAHYEYYDPAHDENSVRRLAMVGELRTAIANDSTRLHYQPQVNLRAGKVESVEALLRWRHPVLGEVSPGEFVALAETTDLIRPLTEWSLAEALRQGRRWRERGLDLRIAVNLSARILQDSAFPLRLRAMLESSGIDATALELEITESAMMLDPARALRVIQEIDLLGVQIAIDDFGTGFSSLGYLRDLPVHSLKLDKSFVRNMRTRVDDRVIVQSTAQMARALRLEIIAEGVESDWDVEFLTAAGYDYAQGYRFSAALPAEACEAWIQGFNALPPPVSVPGASDAWLPGAVAEATDGRRRHVEYDGSEVRASGTPLVRPRRRHG
jgi:diguanylate cyclase (GGDEF)-like protein/PAS domain S-box-containing protein